MGLQHHTPEEKDKMVARIDHLRFKDARRLTLPAACEVVGKEMNKPWKAVKSLYNYWKGVRAGKVYPSQKKGAVPSARKFEDMVGALKTAVNQQGGVDAQQLHAKPVINGRSKVSPKPSRRVMLERLLNLTEKLTEELLSEEGEDQSTDNEA